MLYPVKDGILGLFFESVGIHTGYGSWNAEMTRLYTGVCEYVSLFFHDADPDAVAERGMGYHVELIPDSNMWVDCDRIAVNL